MTCRMGEREKERERERERERVRGGQTNSVAETEKGYDYKKCKRVRFIFQWQPALAYIRLSDTQILFQNGYYFVQEGES